MSPLHDALTTARDAPSVYNNQLARHGHAVYNDALDLYAAAIEKAKDDDFAACREIANILHDIDTTIVPDPVWDTLDAAQNMETA